MSLKLQSYHVGNLQGIGARERQEDSFTVMNAFDVKKIRQHGLMFSVCDGMGGMQDGKVASETAIATFRDGFSCLDKNADISIQLKNTAYAASNMVESALGGQGGSTAVTCIIYQDMLYFVSVGDSFLYMKRGNNLYRLNSEHTMCNQLYLSCIRNEIIDPTAGREDPESVALTQFIGMTGLSDVDGTVRPIPIKEGDVLLACSDGIGGVLSEEEVFYALSMDKPNDMCNSLEKGIIAHCKPNQDNYTAVVVKCVK